MTGLGLRAEARAGAGTAALGFLTTTTHTKDGEQSVWTRGQAIWNHQDALRGKNEPLHTININVVKTETVYEDFPQTHQDEK